MKTVDVYLEALTKRALFIVIGVLAIAPIGCSRREANAPSLSDEDLVKIFHEHRNDFQSLLRMMESDVLLNAVDAKTTNPDPAPVAPERVAEYRRLLTLSGCQEGLSRDGQAMQFSAMRYRISPEAGSKGWTKGYYYSLVKPDGFSAPLDQMGWTTSNPVMKFREIEDHWFLFFRDFGP